MAVLDKDGNEPGGSVVKAPEGGLEGLLDSAAEDEVSLQSLLEGASEGFPLDGAESIRWYCQRNLFLGLLRVRYIAVPSVCKS